MLNFKLIMINPNFFGSVSPATPRPGPHLGWNIRQEDFTSSTGMENFVFFLQGPPRTNTSHLIFAAQVQELLQMFSLEH